MDGNQQQPWSGGPIAVSQGSFPGSDPREPVRIMSGENPDLPSVPELPGRGPGADMIGRALSLLAQVAPEFAGETTSSGWRLAGRVTDPGTRAMRRADSWLAQDVEACEEGYHAAPAIKVAVAGPWTLAANVELRGGHRMLADPGAMRDLRDAYPEVVRRLAGRMRRSWPQVTLQIDEPSLPAVLAAGIATPSGLDAYRSVSTEEAHKALSEAVRAARESGAATVLHCCAVPAPLALLRSVGVDALSLDLTGQTPDGRGGQDEEQLGQLLESEGSLVAGVVAWAVDGPTAPVTATVGSVMALLDRLGIPLDSCAARLAVSTPCGLAGASPVGARATTIRAAEVSAVLAREVA
ncbi:MAG: methionine synthase [Actinobacteria bacterium]|nr:methionine synthase [Actinomycetota bacterium]